MRSFRDSTTRERSFLAEIFLISAAALVLEISYTRIISFKLYYYYTYLVIGLALLGLGSGAVVVAVSKRLRAMSTRRLLLWCSLTGAAGVVDRLRRRRSRSRSTRSCSGRARPSISGRRRWSSSS